MIPKQIVMKKELCPVVASINTIGGKWSLIIIHNLMSGTRSFNELKSSLQGISSKVLAQNLSELQKKEIIEKRIIFDQPEKTEYALTEKGEDLKKLMLEMRIWGERWLTPPIIQSVATECVTELKRMHNHGLKNKLNLHEHMIQITVNDQAEK